MSTVNMRQLTRNTKAVVEDVVRTGRPAIVTINGRPQVAVTPLVGAVEAVEEHVLNDASPELQAAIREGEADLISGRVSRVKESAFAGANEERPSEAYAPAEVEDQLDASRLREAIQHAPTSPNAIEEVRLALMAGAVLTIGFPAGVKAVEGHGARGGIVTYTDDEGPNKVSGLMPVFTAVDILRSALNRYQTWRSFDVMLVNGKSLLENVDPDVTLVIDPGSDEEFRIPPTDLRAVSVEHAVFAPAQLFTESA